MKSKRPDFSDIKENGIVSTVILFFITVIITAALATVNFYTAPVISANAKTTADAARLEVFGSATAFEDVTTTYLPESRKYLRSVIKALDADGNTAGLVIEAYGTGYGGEIRIMAGITSQRELIGFVVLSNNETPGLGTKVALESFTSRFLGGKPGLAFTFNKEDTSLNGVDAITASTISSTAVLTAINASLTFADEVFDKIDAGGDK
ncbi:MAG: RnfABCDGE type electron transport complex subunit G [Saccharofermentanales bacterium]